MFVKTVLIIIAILIVISFVAALILFKVAFVRDSEKKKFVMKHGGDEKWQKTHDTISDAMQKLKQLPYETVHIKSREGLTLAGYYFPCNNARRTVICAHGFKSTGFWDFSSFALYMLKHSFNVLLICERACPVSEGKYMGYGITERYDIPKWIDFINEKNSPEEDIVLAGISMGCATVLMASGFGYGENVKAIIADCGYTRPSDILQTALKNTFHLPVFPIYTIAKLMASCIAKINVDEYSTLDALKTNKTPVFFVHGSADSFVPKEMTMKNYEAAVCEKDLLIVSGAEHGQSFITNPDAYTLRMSAFLNKIGVEI